MAPLYMRYGLTPGGGAFLVDIDAGTAEREQGCASALVKQQQGKLFFQHSTG